MRQKYAAEVGQVFGMWAVVDLAEQPRKPLVRCECGTERNVMIRDLCTGESTNCGCVRRAVMRERATERNVTHGLRNHPHYSRWVGMRRRCGDPKDVSWETYGGRGIRVCPEWEASAEAFIRYMDDVLGPRPAGFTLDRIDVNGNYEPGNVRWASGTDQALNRRPRRMPLRTP